MKLSGIRVLDLSRFLPGPYLTMLMADHGAEVIKIESHQGEPTRQLGPPIAGHPVYFRNTQRGKLSLTLNLKHDEGREDLPPSRRTVRRPCRVVPPGCHGPSRAWVSGGARAGAGHHLLLAVGVRADGPTQPAALA